MLTLRASADSFRPPDSSTRPGAFRSAPSYAECMNTIHLSDSELEMARHALEAYLRTFGHDEADTVREIKRVILKLAAAHPEGEEPRFIA